MTLPTVVDIPVLIRVDPSALARLSDAVEDAVARALAQAGDQVVAEVLEARGGYLDLAASPVDFTWTGPAAEQVGRRSREALEARVERRVAEALGRLQAWVNEARRDAHPTMPRRVESPYERQRHARIIRRYWVPSYDLGDEDEVEVLPEPRLAEARHVRLGDGTFEPQGEAIDLLEQRIAGLPVGAIRGFYFLLDGRHFTPLIAQRTSLATYKYVYRPFAARFKVTVPEEAPSGISGTVVDAPVAAPSPFSRVVIHCRLGREGMESSLRQFAEAQLPGIRAIAAAQAGGRAPADVTLQDAVDAVRATISEAQASSQSLHWWTVSVDGATDFIGSYDHVAWLPATLELEAEPLVSFGDPTQVDETLKDDEEDANDAAGPGRAPPDQTGARGNDDLTGDRRGGGALNPGEDTVPGEGTRRIVFPDGPEPTWLDLFLLAPLNCEPYKDELAIEQLGDRGGRIGALVRTIAAALDMPPCDYPMNFLQCAARRLGAHAFAVGGWAATDDTRAHTEVTAPGSGNVGSLDVTPTRSLAVVYLRHLAGLVPLFQELMQAIAAAYDTDHVQAQGTSFTHLLRVYTALIGHVEEAVGILFKAGCRVVLMQLLRSSAEAIQRRLDLFEEYADVVTTAVAPLLESLDELRSARERLERANTVHAPAQLASGRLVLAPEPSTGTDAGPALRWATASADLALVLTSPVERAVIDTVSSWDTDDMVWLGREFALRRSDGTLWTISDFDAGIQLRQGLAESIDPLVKQLTEIDEVMAEFRAAPGNLRATLERLLKRMMENNKEMRRNVASDWSWAFEQGSIDRDLSARTIPGSSYALRGVHLLTHDAIGDAFGGAPAYGRGVDRVLAMKQGLETMLVVGEIAAIAVLALLCPPAAFLAGVATAGYAYAQAQEHDRLYAALIDPELIRSRAEVEAELFAAKLGLVLSIVPEAGSLLRGAVRGASAVARGAGRRATREAAEELFRHAIRQIGEDLPQRYMATVATDVIVGKLMEPILTPLVEGVASDYGHIGQGAAGDRVLQALDAEAALEAQADAEEEP